MIFALYDDHEEFRLKSEEIIQKLSKENNFDYDVKHFTSFSSSFEQFIEEDTHNKVYILDIEVPNSLSGIEIAKKIRKSDWDSIIIMVTSHTELGYEALKAQIMLLNFISKYNNWKENLEDTLKRALLQIDKKKTLVLESGGITHRIYTNDILYILKDPKERRCTITTTYSEIVVQKSMTEIGNMLDKSFYLSHRSCYIHLDRVSSINWHKNTIYFDNGDSIDYLSRDRKKGLKEYVRNR
jgi:two-component system response regulator AgrA